MNLQDVRFYEEFKHLNLVYFGMFGSRLYGTNMPESDWDFKGIYMPTKREVYLGHYPKSISFKSKEGEGKNGKDDVDIEIWSLPYFLKLAMDGDTSALDLLHTPKDKILRTSAIWDEMSASRKMFFSKNLKSFVGYARTQAAKYGIKGSRLTAMKSVLDYLQKIHDEGPSWYREEKLAFYWDDLPSGDHIHKLGPEDGDKNKYRMYQVCGQKFQETVSPEYMRAGIQKKYDEYGKRAKLAEANEGIDWKAISHAIRAAYQLIEVLTVGEIHFPLSCAKDLRLTKAGKKDYLTQVGPLLESLIETCEQLTAISELPEQVDREHWEDWLVRLVQREIFGEILNNV